VVGHEECFFSHRSVPPLETDPEWGPQRTGFHPRSFETPPPIIFVAPLGSRSCERVTFNLGGILVFWRVPLKTILKAFTGPARARIDVGREFFGASIFWALCFHLKGFRLPNSPGIFFSSPSGYWGFPFRPPGQISDNRPPILYPQMGVLGEREGFFFWIPLRSGPPHL